MENFQYDEHKSHCKPSNLQGVHNPIRDIGWVKTIRVWDEKEKIEEKKKGNHPESEKLGFAGLMLTALEKV